MEGLRRAALALATLSTKDRNWVLSRLPVEQRSRVAPLVDELCEIGMEPGADAYERIRDEEAEQLAAELASGDGAMRDVIVRLNGFTAEVMLDMVDGEPDVVIAALLARYPWRWSRGLLQGLEASRRERVVRLVVTARRMKEQPWRVLVRAMIDCSAILSQVPEEQR